MEIKNLGLLPYDESMLIMESFHEKIRKNLDEEGVILVVSHPPCITMGKRFLEKDMVIPSEKLKDYGVSFYKTDRGGSVTAHEPGQVVIYPVFALENYKHTVLSYVCSLEQAMIDTAKSYGVQAVRNEVNPGVWVGNNKIGAVGIRVQDKVTKHGLAFNVNNSLKVFSHIIPCGLRGYGVTHLFREIPVHFPQPRYEEVAHALAERVRENILASFGANQKKEMTETCRS